MASQRASSTFCWLPPDRLPAMASGLAGRMPSALMYPSTTSSVLRSGDPSEPAALGLQAEHDVLADGQVADDALGLAALRGVDDPARERRARGAQLRRLPLDDDSSPRSARSAP